jgi:hypothetical protein
MDPSIKLVLDEMAKLHTDIKEGFMVLEAAFSKHLEEVTVAATFTNNLIEWRPEVESSITTVKLELSKLNKLFDCDAKPTLSTQSGILPLELAAITTPPSG